MKKEDIYKMILLEGTSEKTASSYATAINMFQDWFGGDAEDATKMDLINYVNYLMFEKKSAPQSTNQAIYALKKFYNITKGEGESPARNLRRIKTQRNSPDIFVIEDMGEIFNKLGARNYERNRLIIILAAICGLRKQEIVDLDIEHFDGKTLSVLGKGNKIRKIMVPDNIKGYITDYCKERTTGPMLLSERGGRISVGAVDNIMRYLSKHTGLNVHMHRFRHTAATNSYKQNNDIKAVQALLGHSSINTTQIYVHVQEEEICELIANSPINNLI